jgi:hypothetical protein
MVAVLFAAAWGIAAAYRAGLMFFLAAGHFWSQSFPAAVACTAFGAVFVYLDTYWEGCFFRSLEPQHQHQTCMVAAKVAGAIAAAAVVLL